MNAGFLRFPLCLEQTGKTWFQFGNAAGEADQKKSEEFEWAIVFSLGA
jgi:hypothetical protein